MDDVSRQLIKKVCFLNEFWSLDCTAYSKRTDIGRLLYGPSAHFAPLSLLAFSASVEGPFLYGFLRLYD
jgi:hypothetical protein